MSRQKQLENIILGAELLEKQTARGFLERTLLGLNAQSVEAYLTAVTKIDNQYIVTGTKRKIKPSDSSLLSQAERGYTHYKLSGSYLTRSLDPYETVTRGDVVIEILNSLENMYSALGQASRQTLGEELLTTISTISKMYPAEDLTDFGTLLDEEDECLFTNTSAV